MHSPLGCSDVSTERCTRPRLGNKRRSRSGDRLGSLPQTKSETHVAVFSFSFLLSFPSLKSLAGQPEGLCRLFSSAAFSGLCFRRFSVSPLFVRSRALSSPPASLSFFLLSLSFLPFLARSRLLRSWCLPFRLASLALVGVEILSPALLLGRIHCCAQPKQRANFKGCMCVWCPAWSLEIKRGTDITQTGP